MKKLHLIFCLLIVACLSSVTTVFGAENSGTEGEKMINITVPTSIQFVKSADGSIIVPDNTAILNGSEVGVKVESVQISTCNDWVVEPYGTDLSNEGKDSKKFAIQLNNETVNETGAITVSDTNWGNIAAGESLALDYNVDIPRTKGIDEQIATIVFTVSSESTEPTEPEQPEQPAYVKKDLVDGDAEIALWEYSIDSETNTATVLNYLGETNAELDLVIPTSFNGAKTTAIKSSTSNWNNYTLKSLTIPKGVRLGGNNYNSCFYKLTADKVVVEDECTLGSYAFYGTIGTMKLGKDITFNYNTDYGYTPFNGTIDTFETDSNIGRRMLEDVTIKHLVLGANCKRLESSAIYGNKRSIESIQGIENIEYIGAYALYGCFSTTAVIDSMTIKATMESRAIGGVNCNTLTFDGSVFKGIGIDGTCSIGTMIVQNSDMSAVSSTIGSNVSVNTLIIGQGNNYGTQSSIFQNLGNLTTVILNGNAPKDLVRGKNTVTTVEINEGCESIGDNAFVNCKSIANITGFEHLRSIGVSAFANAFPTDTSFDVLELNNCTIGNSAFSNYVGIININTLRLNNCTVNDKVFTGNGSTQYFSFGTVEINNCNMTKEIFVYDKINSLNIKGSTYSTSFINTTYSNRAAQINSLTTDCDIPKNAFNNSGITSVTILEGIDSIADNAFSYCNSITSITGLEYVKSIGVSAFFGAFATDAVIDSITLNDCALGNRAFVSNSDVVTIETLSLNNCTLSDEAFGGWSSSQYFSFGTVKLNACSMTKNIFRYDVIDTLIINQSTYTSLGASKVNTLTTDCDIPDSAFRATDVKDLMILDGCKSIGYNAFYNCTNLVEVELPADCTYQSNSFNSATTITVRGETNTIETFSLANDTDIEEVTEPVEDTAVTEDTEDSEGKDNTEVKDDSEVKDETEPKEDDTEVKDDTAVKDDEGNKEQTDPAEESTEEPEQPDDSEPTEEPTEKPTEEPTEEPEQEITEPVDEPKSDDSDTPEDTTTSQDEHKNTEDDVTEKVEESNETVENTDISKGNETTDAPQDTSSDDADTSITSTSDTVVKDDSSAKSDNVSDTAKSSTTIESSVSKSDVSTPSSATSTDKSDSKEKVIKKESKEDTSAKIDE